MLLPGLPQVRIGHWTDRDALTGCTVLLLGAAGMVAGVSVRGAAPGTRETDLLDPTASVERIHALVLTGGSAFGLAAADGVMRRLAELGIGYPVGPARVPIVPAAVLFDLGVGSAVRHPGAADGYAACLDAGSELVAASGRVGAGTGATCGKLLGLEWAVAGGLGIAGVEVPGAGRVVAVAVVNALGDVVDETGAIVAGARDESGGFAGAADRRLVQPASPPPAMGVNTTLVAVLTDARLTKSGCARLAGAAHDGLALSIRPVHTPFDGDTVFAISCGEVEVDPLRLQVAAVEAVRRAVVAAVLPVAPVGRGQSDPVGSA